MIQKFPDLPKSSANEVSALLSFSRSFIFKNVRLAESKETLNSSKSAYQLISAVMKVFPFDSINDPNETLSKGMMNNYVETNEYYLDYLEKINLLKYNRVFNPNIDYAAQGDNFNASLKMIMLTSLIKARVADDHEIIHYSGSFDQKLTKMFLNFYNENLHYYNAVLHTEGFAKYNRYWNYVNFIVNMMTLEKMITAKLDLAFDIDSFDERSMRNMFASYGLDFYEIIPNKYRKRILKNINYLLEFKGTTKALISIMKMFGFEDVKLFKYYLVKDFERDEDGKIIGLGEVGQIPEPNLKFFRVAYDEPDPERAFLDPRTKVDTFDNLVLDDPFWHATESEVAKEDFTYINTKYLGIDVSMNMLKNTLSHAYFYNFLYQFKDAEALSVMASSISNEPIKIFDIVVAMKILTLRSMELEDRIVTDFYSISYVLSETWKHKYIFNTEDKAPWAITGSFDAKVSALFGSNYDSNKTLEENLQTYITNNLTSASSGTVIKGFNNGNGINTNPNNLINSWTDNFEYMNSFRKLLLDETDYEKYRFLKQLYDYKFVSNFYTDVFGTNETFGEYLEAANPNLFLYINTEDQQSALYRLMSLVENFIESTGVPERGFFNETGIPDSEIAITKSAELFSFARSYIKSIVDTFRAYTTQLKNFKVLYIYKDPLNETLKAFEDWEITKWSGFVGNAIEPAFIEDDETMLVRNTMKDIARLRDLVDIEHSSVPREYLNWSSNMFNVEKPSFKEIQNPVSGTTYYPEIFRPEDIFVRNLFIDLIQPCIPHMIEKIVTKVFLRLSSNNVLVVNVRDDMNMLVEDIVMDDILLNQSEESYINIIFGVTDISKSNQLLLDYEPNSVGLLDMNLNQLNLRKINTEVSRSRDTGIMYISADPPDPAKTLIF